MVTIKSFTDLSQSKTLSTILPLESADMHWSKDFDGSWFVDLDAYASVKIPKYVVNVEEHVLPCWSLAALFGVLPKIQGLKPILDLEECSIQYSGIDLYITAGNLFDACYEMILKLNELKLL